VILSKALVQTEKGLMYGVLRERESRFNVGAFLGNQPQVTPRIRAILVDWVADVCHEFNHQEETLQLSVRLVDRLLGTVPVPKRELQLVGCAAILLAAKIEEVFPPSIETLLYLCDNIYTREQLLQMESVVLEKLGFSFTCPTGWSFLTYLFKSFPFPDRARHLAHYLLELGLHDYAIMKEQSSLIVVAIACLSLYNFQTPYQILLSVSGYRPREIARAARLVREMLMTQQERILSAKSGESEEGERALMSTTMEKFAQSSKMRVTKVPLREGFEEDLIKHRF